MPSAVITFDFDPLLQVGDGVVRLETLGIAAATFLALILAGIGARQMELPADDLLFVVLGIVPGAVAGGRIGYVLLHPEFFAAAPERIIDPAVGSLGLSLAVVGGVMTGGIVAALLDGGVGRWFHIATLPLLLVLGVGKLAMVLGGRGQGLPWDGSWATAFVGPGRWGTLAPAVPAHPSQVYEAIGALVVLLLVMGLLTVPGARRPDGRSFLIAVAFWAVMRAIVASTWRDPLTVESLRTEQVIDIAIVVACAIGVVILVLRERPSSSSAATG